MNKSFDKFANIKAQINKLGNGYCALVKLVNYNELCSMFGSAKTFIGDLHILINQICSGADIRIYSYIEYNKIFIILADISRSTVEDLIFQIHNASQLYINDDYPGSSMHCRFTMIDFGARNNDFDSLYTSLIGILSGNVNSRYYCSYDIAVNAPEIIAHNNKELNLLRKALKNKTHKFAYQPIIDRKTGEIPYYECLLRIPDKSDQYISVGPLIERAENKGLINLVDYEVFNMVVDELKSDVKLSLAVNISNVGVLDERFLNNAMRLLSETKVGSRLIIEITETTLNNNYITTKYFIDSLHKFGCRFALDDFGAGFTSFKQLQELPVDIVKIDGSYVKSLINNDQSQYFIEMLVKMSEKLGIKTVAEYVENGAIAKFLIDIKVDGMQGNFFSPAVSTRLGSER